VTFLGWMALAGGLLLAMALSSAYLSRLPVSTALIYLGVGLALGPTGADVVALDARRAPWLEHLTEVAVIVSLYIGGLRLRLPLRHPAWRAAFRLAVPVMLASIAGVAVAVWWLLDVPPAVALLVGAMLAPTDPVLASAVNVSNSADQDRTRYGLSGEAGLNDGMAFPFVVLALEWMRHGEAGPWLGAWALHRLLWAVPAGLAIGYAIGLVVGRTAIALRTHHRDPTATSDFLALSVIALSYVAAELVGAWGFLSVFAAGVGLRRAESQVVAASPHPDVSTEPSVEHPPAEHLVKAMTPGDDLGQPAVAAGVIVAETVSFGDTAERLLEVMLVLVVGIGLANHWDVRAIPIAIVLFAVIRPLATHLALIGTPTTRAERWLLGWFGIRGIGSLYYLGVALSAGLAAHANVVSDLVFSVIALSIVVHGASAQPLIAWHDRRRTRV
jgi:NhaP-type Na+/H+ or K+/H+ antiporter